MNITFYSDPTIKIRWKDVAKQFFLINLAFGILISFTSMGYADFWVILDGAFCWSFLSLLVIGLAIVINKIIFTTPYSPVQISYYSLGIFSTWSLFVIGLSIVFFGYNLFIVTPNPITTHSTFLRIAWLFCSCYLIFNRFRFNQKMLDSNIKAILATLLFESLLVGFIVGFFFLSDQLVPRIISNIN